MTRDASPQPASTDHRGDGLHHRAWLALIEVHKVLEVFCIQWVLEQLLGVALQEIVRYLLVLVFSQIVEQLQDSTMQEIALVGVVDKDLYDDLKQALLHQVHNKGLVLDLDDGLVELYDPEIE